ncbi:MAG TPA: nitroreductase family protein [Actinomycetota bacterium]|nr:nitroreductase family protein [Actinomycetota bacterium]
MDVGEAIRSQRAIRRFADRPIAGEVLEEILDAARRAPSSMNEQRWAFVLVTGPERLRALASVGEYADHLAGAAAAVALVVPEADEDWRRESIAFDLGQCAQNLMLAAWERGIGSAHAAVYEQDLARELLGYPRDRRCDYVLGLGYPARPPTGSGRRRRLDQQLHRDRWG